MHMYSPAKLPAPTGLPAALPLQPPHATPISARLSMLREGDRVVYFVHTDPVCSHTADHKLERNLCLARFALFGLATQSELARAHGISQSTVSRAVQRLQVQGELGFAPAPKPRRPYGIVDPAQLAQAARMLRSGLSLYRVAQQLGVSQSTLWRYTQQGLLPASQCLPRRRAGAPAERDSDAQGAGPQPGGAAPSAPPPAAPGKEDRNRRDAAAPRGRAAHDTAGRVAASLGALDGRAPRFAAAAAVSGGGVLTALPSLLQAGLLRHLDQLTLPKGFYGLQSLLLLWAFLLLGRVRCAERLRYEQPGEWGALLGLDRCPCPRTLRRRTHQLAAAKGLPAWVGCLTQDWCADDPEAVATLFVDGHVQVYSGQGRLPKHFVTRQKLALPASVGYWVHALGGAPLLCLHRQIDAGMVSEIWNGIVPQLRQLGLLAGAGAPRLTLVFDREGWSPRLFRELRALGIAVVTWIKGSQAQRWPDSDFREAVIPVRAPGGSARLEGQLAERPYDLGAGCQAREIRFWIDRRVRGTGQRGQPRKPLELAGRPGPDQRQPALLTTHPDLTAEQAAGLLRSRWTQENFFQYLRAEFGLDTLPEHALVEVEADAWVVNPACRTIGKALKQARNSVGNLRRKLALQADAGSAPARALEARIQTCDQTIQGLLLARKVTDQHILAGELSPEARLQALPQPLRLLLDTLRMLAYRAETAMTTAVAPALDNPDTARSLLKSLLQADASLHPDESAGTLTVRLLHQPTRAQDRALAPLLDELNRTRTVFPGTHLRLVYRMLSDDLPCSASSQPTPANPKPPLPASKLSKPNETV